MDVYGLKFSIITINLNNSKGLEKTIQSVITQSYKNYEYIIIDGDSSDNSVNVIKKYRASISLWISEKDTGIYNAMNKGISSVNGEYLLFLNSGDYLLDNRVLENVAPKITGSNGIYYGNLVVIDKKNKFTYLRANKILSLWHFYKSTVWHPSTFIRKELFKKYGLYDESIKIVADYDFFLKVFCYNRTEFEYLEDFISVFNTDGICNDVNMYDFQMEEREKIQRKYFKMYFSIIFFRIYDYLFKVIINLKKIIKYLVKKHSE